MQFVSLIIDAVSKISGLLPFRQVSGPETTAGNSSAVPSHSPNTNYQPISFSKYFLRYKTQYPNRFKDLFSSQQQGTWFLPTDILVHIFCYVDINSLVWRLPLVCNLFYLVASHEELWRLIVEQQLKTTKPCCGDSFRLTAMNSCLLAPKYFLDTPPAVDMTQKISILSCQHSGATSLINAYLCPSGTVFQEEGAKLDIDFRKVYYRDRKQCNRVIGLQIWEISCGTRPFISGAYVRGVCVVVFVIDLTNPLSLEQAMKTYQRVYSFISEGALLVLVGTKADLEQERQVTKQQVEDFLQQVPMTYVEVSAFWRHSVLHLFDKVIYNKVMADSIIMSAEKKSPPMKH